jgi:AAA ATPase domain
VVTTPIQGSTRRRESGFHSAGLLIRRESIEAEVVQALATSAVVMCGEAGVGKTVLTLAIADQLAEQGLDVVRVGARPDPTRPMEVIADVLEQLTSLRPALMHELFEHPATNAAVARLSGDPSRSAMSVTREQLIRELMSVICEVVAIGDTLLIVEDAHWLDNSSAEILGLLVELRLVHLLITTRRSLEDAFGAVWSCATQIDVPAFSVAEVRELVDLVLPVRATDDLAEDLHQGTGGNGLFLRLKLDLLAEGELGRELPSTLLHAVHERTAGFSEATRDALRTAALLGQTFSLAPLLRVHPHLYSALQDAVDERLVRVDVEVGTGQFVHGLVVDALVERMRPATRIARHDQLCRALADLGESPIAIAKQAVGAEELDRVRVVVSCLAAAQQQAQVFEWASVIEWAEIGLRAASQCSAGERTEAELHELVGKGLRRLNRPGSGEHLSRAADLADGLADHELFVRCVTDLCLHGPTTRAGDVDAPARSRLERALAAPVEDLQRAELLSAAATLLAMSDESDMGRSLYRQALALAENAGDPATLRTIRLNAHLGLAHPDDLAARRRATAGLLALDDLEAQWEGNFLRFSLALIDADRRTLDESIVELRRLTSMVKQRNQRRALHQMESAFAFINGDLDEAARLADTTFQISLESYPMSWAMSIYAALIVPVREAQGRVAELLSEVTALLESSPDFITWHVVAACVAYARDDEVGMARELDHLAKRDFRFVEDFTWTACATIVCRPIWAMRDRAAADALYSRLLPYSGQMTWNGLSTHGPVDAGLACLASVLDDSDRAIRHLEKCRQLVDRLGAPHLFWPELTGLVEENHTH